MTKAKKAAQKSKDVCGIVMPISAMGTYTADHWSDVMDIIEESAKEAGFSPTLVSEGQDIGIIHERIITNLYDNPIVVCDVSGKNPNVMFELGLRLAFDKPTIVIKDDDTSYSFDTSPIEHLTYPRDLRYQKIEEFKKKLADKIVATHRKATTDPANYTTFLKHFGQFKVAKLESMELSKEDYIVATLRRISERLDWTPAHIVPGDLKNTEFDPDSAPASIDGPASLGTVVIAKGRSLDAIRALLDMYELNEYAKSIVQKRDGIKITFEFPANTSRKVFRRFDEFETRAQ